VKALPNVEVCNLGPCEFLEQYGADARHKPKPTSSSSIKEYRLNPNRYVARNKNTLEANEVLPNFKLGPTHGSGERKKVWLELRANLQWLI